jgi:hypothetical protein
MSKRLQQPVSAVDQTALNHARFSREFVRPDRACTVDVQHFMAMRHKPIRHQHTVTVEINAFRAHVGRERLVSQPYQFARCARKFSRQHVVGIIAEAVVAKGDVWRVFQNLLAVSTESLHPDVPNFRRRQRLRERVAVELWKPSRRRKGSNIHQRSDLVCTERLDQFFERASGMSDGVQSRQRLLVARRCNVKQGMDDKSILLWKNRPQVQ